MAVPVGGGDVVMFEKAYNVVVDGKVLATFPEFGEAYALAMQHDEAKPSDLVQASPFYMSWPTIEQLAAKREEAGDADR